MAWYSSKCFKIIQNCLELVKKLHPRAPVVRLVIFHRDDSCSAAPEIKDYGAPCEVPSFLLINIFSFIHAWKN